MVPILLCGSLLGRLDKDMLKKAAIRYIPVIIIGELFAIAGSFIAGKLLGYDLFNSVILVAFPCFSGGSGGPLGAIPMSISNALGIDGSTFVGKMMAGATLANVEAILLSGLLDLVGKKKPSWTGNGVLVRSKDKELDVNSAKGAPFTGKFEDMFRAFLVMGTITMCGSIISVLLKPVVNLNYLVYVILICIIVKLSGILPKDWEDSMAHWMGFALPLLLPSLIAGMGIGSIDLVATFSSITPAFFILVTVTVVSFVIGSMLGGWIIGFYPVEAGISVGCCSCNIGGTGDIICCETAHRVNLYPFASLSTRLGGAIALLELGFLLQFVKL
jgi:Na+/citrate or Na+/malate symporter